MMIASAILPSVMPDDWISVADAADLLDVTRWAVWALIRDGKLTRESIGRMAVLKRADVLALKAERPAVQRRGRPRKQLPAAPPGPGAD